MEDRFYTRVLRPILFRFDPEMIGHVSLFVMKLPGFLLVYRPISWLYNVLTWESEE